MKKILFTTLCALISMQAYCSEQNTWVDTEKVERIQLTDTPGHYMYKKGFLYAQRMLNGDYVAYAKWVVEKKFYFAQYHNSKEVHQRLDKEYRAQPGAVIEDKSTNAAHKSLLEALTNAYCRCLQKKKE